MKLESQVASLDLCKRLKELGVKQDAYFVWAKDGAIFSDGEIGLRMNHRDGTEECSAFTVAELGETLPQYVEVPAGLFYLWMCFEGSPRRYDVHYSEFETPLKVAHGMSGFKMATEADARCAMLIYLIENKLLNPTQLNP